MKWKTFDVKTVFFNNNSLVKFSSIIYGTLFFYGRKRCLLKIICHTKVETDFLVVLLVLNKQYCICWVIKLRATLAKIKLHFSYYLFAYVASLSLVFLYWFVLLGIYAIFERLLEWIPSKWVENLMKRFALTVGNVSWKNREKQKYFDRMENSIKSFSRCLVWNWNGLLWN